MLHKVYSMFVLIGQHSL